MKQILYHGTVITNDPVQGMLENGAVVWEDGTILEVGASDAMLQKYPDARRCDARGGIIFPAFINTHHHIYSAFARGLSIPGNQPTNFLEILEGTWWNIDRHLTRRMTRYSAYMTLLECIRSGVTTVFDHHASFAEIPGSLSEIAQAAQELGVRACLCYEISDRDGPEKARQSVQENVDFARACQANTTGMLAALCGMHASFTISEQTMELARQQTEVVSTFTCARVPMTATTAGIPTTKPWWNDWSGMVFWDRRPFAVTVSI